MIDNYDHQFKLVVVGDSGVGKSSLLLRYSDDIFTSSFISTIGVGYRIRTEDLNKKKIKLQIWDTVGQNKYRSFDSNLRGAHACLICFDTTDSKSFKNVNTWIADCRKEFSENVNIILVGCKSDLVNRKMVDYESAEQFANKNGIVYIETSSKDSRNVEEAFRTVMKQIYDRVIPKESLIALKEVVAKHFNKYVTSISSSASGVFMAYTRQSKAEYDLQEEYRANIAKYFSKENNNSFTEKDFIEETLLIIKKSEELYKSEALYKKEKALSSFVASFFLNTSVLSPLSKALTDTLTELSNQSPVIKKYVDQTNGEMNTTRNYRTV